MKKTISFIKKLGHMYMNGIYEYGTMLYRNGNITYMNI